MFNCHPHHFLPFLAVLYLFREGRMSKAEVMMIMILFHSSGYRCLNSNMKGAMMSVSDKLLLRKRAIIETVNDELKNIAQIEHSRHR